MRIAMCRRRVLLLSSTCTLLPVTMASACETESWWDGVWNSDEDDTSFGSDTDANFSDDFNTAKSNIGEAIWKGAKTGGALYLIGAVVTAPISLPAAGVVAIGGLALGMGYELMRGNVKNADLVADRIASF